MTWTILGATGFVGSHLTRHLQALGDTVVTPARDADLRGADLGDAIYCIGMTADFRQRPFDTVTAHVGRLQQILQTCDFRSLTYLSSARVYKGLTGLATETTRLTVDPADPDDLYNLSKLMGESLALSCGRPVRVVRLSNVYGPDLHSANFLTDVLSAALAGAVTLRTAWESAKDYISVDQVVELLPAIARHGRERIYNVASGQNVSHGDILTALQLLTHCQVDVAPGAPTVRFPPIDVTRITGEFGFRPRRLIDDLAALIGAYREKGTRE